MPFNATKVHQTLNNADVPGSISSSKVQHTRELGYNTVVMLSLFVCTAGPLFQLTIILSITVCASVVCASVDTCRSTCVQVYSRVMCCRDNSRDVVIIESANKRLHHYVIVLRVRGV